jgi:hypothetical protein
MLSSTPKHHEIHKSHSHEAARGPYLNPIRTSQEAAMRLSNYKN